MKRPSVPTGGGPAIAGRDDKERAAGALQAAGVRLALGLRLASPHAVRLADNAFFARGDVLGLHLAALHAVKVVAGALFTRKERRT